MVFLLVRLYQGTGDAPALSCLCHRQEGLSGCRQRMGIENAGREVGGGVEGKGQAKSCTTVWTPLPPLAAQSGAPDSCRAGTKLPLRHPPQQLPRQLEHQFPAKTAVPHRRLLQAALFKQLKTIPLAACTSTRDPAVLAAPKLHNCPFFIGQEDIRGILLGTMMGKILRSLLMVVMMMSRHNNDDDANMSAMQCMTEASLRDASSTFLLGSKTG